MFIGQKISHQTDQERGHLRRKSLTEWSELHVAKKHESATDDDDDDGENLILRTDLWWAELLSRVCRTFHSSFEATFGDQESRTS